jgi:hypothetical protein
MVGKGATTRTVSVRDPGDKELQMGLETEETERITIPKPEPLQVPSPQPVPVEQPAGR